MTFSSSQSYVLVALGVLLPHLALGHCLGISIPEPFFSLLLLASISALTHVYLKPTLLDLLVSSTDDKLKDVETWGYASQAAASLQWVSFVVLWDAILTNRWPCPPGANEWKHTKEVESWTMGFGMVSFFILVAINSTPSSLFKEFKRANDELTVCSFPLFSFSLRSLFASSTRIFGNGSAEEDDQGRGRTVS